MFFTACDDPGDSMVDPVNDNLIVTDVDAPSRFLKTTSDSVLTTTITLGNNSYIPSSIWVNLKESNGSELYRRNINMYDDGGNTGSGDQSANDNVFTGTIKMTTQEPSGKYNLEYYYSDAENISRKLSIVQFTYDNGENNLPPEIVNITAPDTIIIQDPKATAQLTAEIYDVNGLRDIEKVWFTVVRPNGTSNGYEFIMYDDGNFQSHGDELLGDGIYSLVIEAVPGQTQGLYKFNFRALDKAGHLSNIVSHTIQIEE